MRQTKFNHGLQKFLAVSVVLSLVGSLAAILWLGNIPAAVHDIVLVLMTIIGTEYKAVYAFAFNGTADQAKKDEDANPPPKEEPLL